VATGSAVMNGSHIGVAVVAQGAGYLPLVDFVSTRFTLPAVSISSKNHWTWAGATYLTVNGDNLAYATPLDPATHSFTVKWLPPE
jgi:hypothetical protein